MSSKESSRLNLQRLAESGHLKPEPAVTTEIAALLESAAQSLADAHRSGLSDQSRFTLAYNAGHALALAALRACDFRPAQGPGHRAIVFQSLPHTAGAPAELWVPLDKSHRRRNELEYNALVTFSRADVDQLTKSVSDLERLVRATIVRERPDLPSPGRSDA
jgi:hypothetical protein